MKHSTTAHANKKTGKGILIVLLILAIGAVGYFLLPKQLIINRTAEPVFANLDSWIPNASWSKPIPTKEETSYGTISGVSQSTTITTENASILHENTNFVERLGFYPDNNLSADGPGSSIWGYKQEKSGKVRYVIFSYHTQPTNSNPNEPLQFDCPCQTTVTVFVSQ